MTTATAVLPQVVPALFQHAQTMAAAFDTFCSRSDRSFVFWRGSWWEWTGVCYRQYDDDMFTASVDGFITRLFVMQAQGAGPSLTRKLRGDIVACIKSRRTWDSRNEAPFSLLTKDKSESHHITFSDGRVLDVNAMLSDEAEPLRACSPNWFSTAALPFIYDAQARCTRFELFLDEITMGDDKLRQFIVELMGWYCIYDYQHQHAVILTGEGGNGKSVLTSTITALLGVDNVSTVALENFGKRFQLVPTIGKLLNIAPEVSAIDRQAEEQLKAISGGDRLTIDVKYGAVQNVPATARLLFVTNEMPTFFDRSGGLARRLVIIPFNRQIPREQQDPKLVRKLHAELPGIFNLAMAGLKALQARGAFDIPAVCHGAVDAHMLSSNPARAFLREFTDRYPTATCASSLLYASYREWFAEEGFPKAMFLAQPQFAEEVFRHWQVRAERVQFGGVRQRAYVGLRILDSGNG